MDETPEQQIAKLTAQVGELTASNSDLQGQLRTSQGELRTVRHKATFKEQALAGGVKPKAVEALYRLSGYDPGEADEADADGVAELIRGAREEHDYCFEPESPAGGKGPTPPPATPPPKVPGLGAARGKAPTPAGGKFRVSKADTANPAWLMANAEAYQAAGKAGTLEIVD